MKMTNIIAISAFGILLTACDSNQMQVEGSSAAVAPAMGPEHIHNVEGYGDFTHRHTGNSTAGHSHSWAEIQREIKNRKQ